MTLEPLETNRMEPGKFGFRLQSPDSSDQYLISTADEIEMQLWCNAIIKQKIMIEDAINKIMF